MSHQFKRGRKSGSRVPYTIGNLTEHLWGSDVIQFEHWRTAIKAMENGIKSDPTEGSEIDDSREELLYLCSQAIQKGDKTFFIKMGRCFEHLPDLEWGKDPYLLAIVMANTMIYLKNAAAKGMKMTRQDVCKLACSLLPPSKNYEAARVNIFKRIRKVLPGLPSARSKSKKKATKSR